MLRKNVLDKIEGQSRYEVWRSILCVSQKRRWIVLQQCRSIRGGGSTLLTNAHNPTTWTNLCRDSATGSWLIHHFTKEAHRDIEILQNHQRIRTTGPSEHVRPCLEYTWDGVGAFSSKFKEIILFIIACVIPALYNVLSREDCDFGF